MDSVAAGIMLAHPQCRPEVEDAEPLATAVGHDVATLDEELAGAVEHWRLERVGMIERTIMRLALYELTRGSAPPKVVISEAVQLAHWFAGGPSPSFVNGVLDGLARSHGLL
jgi:N utilization substance protein B